MTARPATAAATAAAATAAARRAWLPRQHGAWAMLILPILVSVVASSPAPWHLALTGAALSGYLASAAFQGWSRSRRVSVFRRPLLVYTAAFAAISLPLPGLLAG